MLQPYYFFVFYQMHQHKYLTIAIVWLFFFSSSSVLLLHALRFLYNFFLLLRYHIIHEARPCFWLSLNTFTKWNVHDKATVLWLKVYNKRLQHSRIWFRYIYCNYQYTISVSFFPSGMARWRCTLTSVFFSLFFFLFLSCECIYVYVRYTCTWKTMTKIQYEILR